MKISFFITLFFLTAPVTLAQVNELIGTWTVIEMTNKSDQDSSKLTEDQFKSNGLFFDCFFMENSKFKQTGNLADEANGAVTTQEGTWKISGNNLIVTLEMSGNKFDLDYTWELKNQTLILSRTWPGMKVIMAFRKKQ
jgi:hypothetical protein